MTSHLVQCTLLDAVALEGEVASFYGKPYCRKLCERYELLFDGNRSHVRLSANDEFYNLHKLSASHQISKPSGSMV